MNYFSFGLFLLASFFYESSLSASILSPVSLNTIEANLIDLQNNQRKDKSCFVKFDNYLAKLWGAKVNETSISDVGKISEYQFPYKSPSKPKYNTVTQQWLMEEADHNLKLRTCYTNLFESISDKIDEGTRTCLNELFKKLNDNEEKYSKDTERLFKDETKIPFREFLSFIDIKDLVFQNRTQDNLTDHEKSTYGHLESYVPSDEDKNERAWILRQECDWRDLKELRESKDDKETVELFKNQIIRSVDRQLGNRLVREIDINANISHADLTLWLKARENMNVEINNIVDKLDTVKNDSLWMCEAASEIGHRFASLQAAIFKFNREQYVDLKTYNIAKDARAIEKHLETINDTRRGHFKNLADNFESEMLCLNSLETMLVNHQRYELANSFLNNNLSYPQIYCREVNTNIGLLAPEYCKCVGTFCVSHQIAALYAERFELKKNETTGMYKVFVTNVNRPTKRVTGWPGVKEDQLLSSKVIFDY